MNKMSKGSIQLTEKELAGVSGGKDERVIVFEPVTIIVYTKGSTIVASPKK